VDLGHTEHLRATLHLCSGEYSQTKRGVKAILSLLLASMSPRLIARALPGEDQGRTDRSDRPPVEGQVGKPPYRTPCRCRQTRIPAAPSPKMSPCWGCPRSTATDLNILGRPDGVRTSTGALPPIEIKSHRDVSKTDELELHSTGLASIAESIFRARKSATSGRPWPAEARGRFVKAGSPG